MSHIVVSASRKPIFGYLGMVYGALLRLFIRRVFSQIHMNTFSVVRILLEVVVNKDCGKASSDNRLRRRVLTPRLLGEMLNTITLRNLIRSAGAALPIRSTYNNGRLTLWFYTCVEVFNQENTCTALQTGIYGGAKI